MAPTDRGLSPLLRAQYSTYVLWCQVGSQGRTNLWPGAVGREPGVRARTNPVLSDGAGRAPFSIADGPTLAKAKRTSRASFPVGMPYQACLSSRRKQLRKPRVMCEG
jgi:hypothetical protein